VLKLARAYSGMLMVGPPERQEPGVRAGLFR